ncbi:glycosyltransferase [Mycoplasma todarodis]|uniref:glycosyltransferase n=1 Tax=Mycoplasma todarodis TaxID=1937191 RepID=UPI003B36C922
MKKIAILHYSLGGTGGLSRMSTTLANYWVNQGHDVIRIGLDQPVIESPYFVDEKVVQTTLRKNKEVSTNKFSFSPTFIWRITTTLIPNGLITKKRLNKSLEDRDVIIVQNPLILKWLSKKNKQKTTLYLHHQYGGGALMGRLINFQKHTINKKVKKVVCLDPKTEKILNNKFKNVEFKFIPNFLNGEMKPLKPKRQNITFMGRIAHIKNIDWIVAASKEIKNDIYIYGNIADDYKKTWDSMEKPSNLKYMGRTNNALEVLANSKIGLHTGSIEGYSLSMIESACAGNLLVSAPSWDSFDENIKDIMYIANNKQEFISQLKKAIEAPLPTKKQVDRIKEYYSFERYIQILEGYIFT